MGFCITDKELKSLPRGTYTIVVDTELYKGQLITGDYVLEGERKDEIMLLLTYVTRLWQIMNFLDH